jgi:hypothetical protein
MGNDWWDADIFEATQTFQLIAHNFLFYLQLSLVTHMLEVAATARAKVRAGGLQAIRRRGDDVEEFGAVKFVFIGRHAHPHCFAGNSKGDEVETAVFIPANGGTPMRHIGQF